MLSHGSCHCGLLGFRPHKMHFIISHGWSKMNHHHNELYKKKILNFDMTSETTSAKSVIVVLRLTTESS